MNHYSPILVAIEGNRGLCRPVASGLRSGEWPHLNPPVSTHSLRDHPSPLGIHRRHPCDEKPARAQTFRLPRTHQSRIRNVNESLLGRSEPSHLSADLAQKRIVDLLVRGVAILVFAINGDLVSDAKRRDRKLLEIRTAVLAVAFGDLQWGWIGCVRFIAPIHIHGCRVETHYSCGYAMLQGCVHGRFGANLPGTGFKKKIQSSPHGVVIERACRHSLSRKELRVPTLAEIRRTIRRRAPRKRIQSKP